MKSDSFDDGDVEPLFEDLEDCEEQPEWEDMDAFPKGEEL